ncbi:hypothetical protein LZ31DRAFT_555884 [Colletotrichum somersetense]|nr:hypothetical protein LZ31DRAFT_555884 [Colletotrichum somersetense]
MANGEIYRDWIMMLKKRRAPHWHNARYPSVDSDDPVLPLPSRPRQVMTARSWVPESSSRCFPPFAPSHTTLAAKT